MVFAGFVANLCVQNVASNVWLELTAKSWRKLGQLFCVYFSKVCGITDPHGLRRAPKKMSVPKDAHNVALKQLEEELSTECHISDAGAGVDDSAAAGGADEIDIVERGVTIGQEGIRRPIIRTIEDIVDIYFEA